MKTEKQLLLDELDSCMTKFDESWDEKNYNGVLYVYYKMKDINESLGNTIPDILKLIDYSKLPISDRELFTNQHFHQ